MLKKITKEEIDESNVFYAVKKKDKICIHMRDKEGKMHFDVLEFSDCGEFSNVFS